MINIYTLLTLILGSFLSFSGFYQPTYYALNNSGQWIRIRDEISKMMNLLLINIPIMLINVYHQLSYILDSPFLVHIDNEVSLKRDLMSTKVSIN
ncbi:unnamed protein product [Caenorhabditis angaria]|uniref:Uncharacterized protein n=1 Tax=Caenorhabditis angaria TaxID=860376 RepID=A0A9P1IC37_9PELO|nr:unnamed protein product [Caenorhabditis angaria]